MLKVLKNIRKTHAQATVEAAIMIPAIFLLLLILLQPGIILYDLTIMNSAASETCRVLATSNDVDKTKICDAFARRRLSAIPQQENFHCHNSGCSYEFELIGDHSSNMVTVSIKNQLQPLPLIGFISNMTGILNDKGMFEIEAKSTQTIKPSWVQNNPAGNLPDNWVGAWLK